MDNDHLKKRRSGQRDTGLLRRGESGRVGSERLSDHHWKKVLGEAERELISRLDAA